MLAPPCPWGWTHEPAVLPGSTRVVATLTPEPDGTRVVLRHYGLRGRHQRAGPHQGWITYLNRPNNRITGREAGPDPNT